MRCPVHTLIVPNNTLLAFLPVMGIIACRPRNDHALLKIGNKRKMVSSSNSTALAGIHHFNRLIMPLFSGLGLDLFQNKNNEDVCILNQYSSFVVLKYED